MTKILLIILAALTMATGVHLFYTNGFYESDLSIRHANSIAQALPPGEEVEVVIELRNPSARRVAMRGGTGSCRLSVLSFPDEVPGRSVRYLHAVLRTPSDPGTYEEAVLVRTDAPAVYHGANLSYTVSREAAAPQAPICLGRVPEACERYLAQRNAAAVQKAAAL